MEEIIEKEIPDGIYNLTSSEGITRYEFARILNKRYFLNCDIMGISSEKLNRPALRPRYSSLDRTKLEKVLNRKLESFSEQLNMYDNE